MTTVFMPLTMCSPGLRFSTRAVINLVIQIDKLVICKVRPSPSVLCQEPVRDGCDSETVNVSCALSAGYHFRKFTPATSVALLALSCHVPHQALACALKLVTVDLEDDWKIYEDSGRRLVDVWRWRRTAFSTSHSALNVSWLRFVVNSPSRYSLTVATQRRQ
jgi:hypothetical protein